MTERPGARTSRSKKPGAKAGVIAMTVVLGIFAVIIVWRAVVLLTTGNIVAIGIGIAVLAIMAVAVAVLVPEYRLASTVQHMGSDMAASGELPVDDLPRSPGGRIDRAVADEEFAQFREAVEKDPENWRAWYNLAFAYDACHDRRRARETLRKASALYRQRPSR